MHTAVQIARARRERFQPVPTPSFAPMATPFNGVYMRPNLSNGGQVPAAGPYCTCPDIWPSGPTPVPNFQTALATSSSYNSNPPDQITLYMDNYIYVRGYNGTN